MNATKYYTCLTILILAGINSEINAMQGKDILEQFFYQQIHYRLSKAFLLLRKINTTDLKILCKNNTDVTNALTMHSNIKHERVRRCLNDIKREKTISPCIQLIDEFESGRYTYDPLFTREFAYLILTIGKELLVNCLTISRKKTVLTYIIQQCEKLTPNDIMQILNAIDIITQELAHFIEKYELDTKTTWKEWLKRYWWAPPLIIGTIGLKVLLQYKIYQNPTAAPPTPHEELEADPIALP